ncbi:heterokaryon incompatibility protein-domain-containing protein [Nemania abortiva]|nr:heterokaryon incompatibility protein-domain-containing protein [Nemania abortiva]
MWLIDTSTLKLRFVTEAEKGSYAILSHTWGEDEVSFEQFRNLSPQSWLDDEQRKKAFVKIAKTCELASQHGLPYAWVDTCCIDKTSSAELSEAINSMFRYYQNAAFCIALISDLPNAPDGSGLAAHFESQFPRCRWLTRGWTLQELIAPPKVLFYDSSWAFRGSKHDWKPLLAKETGVDEAILVDSSGLRFIPVARRMSWASTRQTTRTEDMAYCLLGIFDVNMPLIYGEGRKAFMRLQEEIAKDSCDLSLFAWQQTDSSQKYRGVLATSVAEFLNCREIKHRIQGAIIPTEFSLTNRGLRIETALVNVPSSSDNFILNLGFSYRDDWPIYSSRGWLGVHLAKTNNGFVRARPDRLFQADEQGRLRCPPGLIHIRKTVDPSDSAEIERRFDRAIRVELSKSLGRPGAFRLERVAPEGLWVENQASFLHQGRGINAYIQCGIRLSDHIDESIIVACSTMGDPVCAIWHSHDNVWGSVAYFLNNCNERADFVAVDYLRVHFLSREGHFTSTATKRLDSQETGNSIFISAELKEDTDEGGRSQFILHIHAWAPHQADGEPDGVYNKLLKSLRIS